MEKVTLEKVKKALFDLGGDKAPGIDDFLAIIFQKF